VFYKPFLLNKYITTSTTPTQKKIIHVHVYWNSGLHSTIVYCISNKDTKTRKCWQIYDQRRCVYNNEITQQFINKINRIDLQHSIKWERKKNNITNHFNYKFTISTIRKQMLMNYRLRKIFQCVLTLLATCQTCVKQPSKGSTKSDYLGLMAA